MNNIIAEFLFWLIFPIFASGIIIYYVRERLRKRTGQQLTLEDFYNE